MSQAPVVGAALKWAPLRPAVDPLTGAPVDDPLADGVSAADEAALEVALLLAEQVGGIVRAATVGREAALGALRLAVAAGALQAIHVLVDDAPAPGLPATCARTARGLATALRGCSYVVCGDHSTDGGTGAVPGLLAAAVGAAQALGLARVRLGGAAGAVEGERRLDRGAIERLAIEAPAVLSVEASAASLRRAPLTGLVSAPDAFVERLVLPAGGESPLADVVYVPYRPRTRVVPPPRDPSPADRVQALLGIHDDREPPRVVRSDPAEAAREIAAQLRRWGYA